MSAGKSFGAKLAMGVARKVVDALTPGCERIEIVGSLRRMKTTVHDVDIVVLPKTEEEVAFDSLLARLVEVGSLRPIRTGPKIRSYVATKTGVPIDIYVANSHTWASLVLIRTGSKEHNVRLAQRARELGMKLKASGEGIEGSDGNLIQIQSEEEVFALLRLPYRVPEQRD